MIKRKAADNIKLTDILNGYIEFMKTHSPSMAQERKHFFFAEIKITLDHNNADAFPQAVMTKDIAISDDGGLIVNTPKAGDKNPNKINLTDEMVLKAVN